MIVALAYMSCVFFLHFFAQSLPMLLVAQILIGVPWGSEFDISSPSMVRLADLVQFSRP